MEESLVFPKLWRETLERRERHKMRDMGVPCRHALIFLPAVYLLNFLLHLSVDQIRVMLDTEHYIRNVHVHISFQS
jgi:hypothetical protein